MRLQALIAAVLLCAAPIFAAPIFATAAFAHQGIHIDTAYARTNGGIGATGAIFLEIANHADTDDRLLGVASDVAEKVELHSHNASGDGVMRMSAVPAGVAIAALQGYSLKRGGDHIMLMGLRQDLKDGDIIHLTLSFEHAGEVKVEVPVDNARKPDAAAEPMPDMQGMDHSMMEAAPSN